VELQKSAIHTDLDLLTRLKSLSFLTAVEMRGLANSLHSTYFRKGEVIFDQKALTAGVHILLAGAAKITCLNRGGERVVVTLLAPGPMPEFFSFPVTRWQFRCEAYRDCRVGQVSWGSIRRHYQGGVSIRFKNLSREQPEAMVSVESRLPRPRRSRASAVYASPVVFELWSHGVAGQPFQNCRQPQGLGRSGGCLAAANH